MPASKVTVAKIREGVAKYAPYCAVDRLVDHIVRRSIHIRITPSRRSKYGDYSGPTPKRPYHAISINGNLTREFFLLVLLHELAHLETHVLNARRVKPHGYEWQQQYRNLLLDYRDCFPVAAQSLIDRYTRQIPLHGPTGKQLDNLLEHFGKPNVEQPLTLNDLSVGTVFRMPWKAGHTFICIEKRRTRWLCRELTSGMLVIIGGNAPVSVVSPR